MKVLLTLEGGFAKTLFEVATDSGKDKHTVAMFLMGFDMPVTTTSNRPK